MELKTRRILARNLKNERKVKGLQQTDIAEMAGMSVRGYGKIERCEVSVTIDSIEKLAKALDVPVWSLLMD